MLTVDVFKRKLARAIKAGLSTKDCIAYGLDALKPTRDYGVPGMHKGQRKASAEKPHDMVGYLNQGVKHSAPAKPASKPQAQPQKPHDIVGHLNQGVHHPPEPKKRSFWNS